MRDALGQEASITILVEDKPQAPTATTSILKAQELLKDTTSRVQKLLTEKGFDPHGVDGIMGPNTRSALRKFRKSQGLPESGELDDKTLRALGI